MSDRPLIKDSFPRKNNNWNNNYRPSFPVTLNRLNSYINNRYIDYTIDTMDTNLIIEDRNTDFILQCKYHGNKKFNKINS